MKRILVVDNHPMMLKFMVNLLEKEGHRVATAQDGLSALEILKTFIPDVIFIDLIMPNIDGAKLCRIVRKMPKLKSAYVIILSAIAAEEDTDIGQFGANACIAKGPFNKMGKHILAELAQSEAVPALGKSRKVKGLEDIDQREITKELLSSKRHFEVILEHMSEGILELTLDAKIVYANPSAIALIGIAEEELLGSEFVGLFAGSHRKRVEDLLTMIENARLTITEDNPVKLKDKETAISFLSVKEDVGSSILLILKDVSERKRMEAKLQQSRKLEAVGTLAGGIAHDFNNLLMGIQGNTSLMLMDIDCSHPHYDYLKSIEKLVQSGSRLTSQLIGYARKGKYTVRPVDLNQLVKDTSEVFGRTRKELSIHTSFVDDLFLIEADEGQMEQVLLNLYVNAWQAMSDSGELRLQTANLTHEDLKGRHYDPNPGNYVALTVTDTGVGMDKKTQERIFDPFFTTREMGRGTGLGLASVYGIVKGHGGYIDVHSEIGQGTTFSIYIPASEKRPAAQKKLTREILEGSEGVLLVDDEDMILDVGRQMLKGLGYKVLVARSGREALKIYRRNRHRIDMVVLDVVMPGMDGSETYDRLNKINPNIRVLLSSGYSIEEQAADILQRGCKGFIQKPFNMKDLSQKLRESLV